MSGRVPMPRRIPAGWRAVFGVPLLVGLATLAGLLAALLHEGAGWVAAWLSLSLPLALIAWHVGKAYLGKVQIGKAQIDKAQLAKAQLAKVHAPRDRLARRT